MNETAANLQTGDNLLIDGQPYQSRLLVGTGKYRDLEQTRQAIEACGAENGGHSPQ